MYTDDIKKIYETQGHLCASCGEWHYEIICPKCGSVVIVDNV